MSKINGIVEANHQSCLAIWSKSVEQCRNSGMTVKSWCEAHGIKSSTYYYWQRKLYQALHEQRETRFVEVPAASLQPCTPDVVATLLISDITVEVHACADEATLATLIRALKSC